MPKRNTVLTWEAIYDVTDIADYIESEFGAERADKFQEEIKEQFRLLSEVNVRFYQTGILYREYIIYMKPFPPSIIFYTMIDSEVHILRVLREERNWESVLEREKTYTYPGE